MFTYAFSEIISILIELAVLNSKHTLGVCVLCTIYEMKKWKESHNNLLFNCSIFICFVYIRID